MQQDLQERIYLMKILQFPWKMITDLTLLAGTQEW